MGCDAKASSRVEISLSTRGFDSRSEQYQERAALIVNSGADVLVCGGDVTIRAAQQVTRTIPIAGVADDMVASGLVASLARPGGNTTGVSIMSTEFDEKLLAFSIERSIGGFVSYGCIRMYNADILDLYDRVGFGTTVVVTR